MEGVISFLVSSENETANSAVSSSGVKSATITDQNDFLGSSFVGKERRFENSLPLKSLR